MAVLAGGGILHSPHNILSEKEIRRIAYHEAGHAVVAVHEGFKPPYILVHPEGAQAMTASPLPGASLKIFMRSRLRVLLAGAVAQCFALSPKNGDCVERACTEVDARGDWEKAKEIMAILIHEQTEGRESDPSALGRIRDDLREAYSAEIRLILSANRRVLDELSRIIAMGFEELSSMEKPINGQPKLYVDPLGVEEALGTVKHVALGDGGAA